MRRDEKLGDYPLLDFIGGAQQNAADRPVDSRTAPRVCDATQQSSRRREKAGPSDKGATKRQAGIAITGILALALISGIGLANSVRMLISMEKGKSAVMRIAENIFVIDPSEKYGSHFPVRRDMSIGDWAHASWRKNFLDKYRSIYGQSSFFNDSTDQYVTWKFAFPAYAPSYLSYVTWGSAPVVNHHSPRRLEIRSSWPFSDRDRLGIMDRNSIDSATQNISTFVRANGPLLILGKDSQLVGGPPEGIGEKANNDSSNSGDNAFMGLDKSSNCYNPTKRISHTDALISGLIFIGALVALLIAIIWFWKR